MAFFSSVRGNLGPTGRRVTAAEAAAVSADSDFEYTAFLLTSETASNTTAFSDSSGNALDVDYFGKAAASNFSPYVQEWGWLGNGTTNSYVSVSNMGAFAGTSDFCVEFWHKGAGMFEMSFGPTGGYSPISINSSGQLYMSNNNSAWTDFGSALIQNDGKWHHYAIIRSSTFLAAYRDGSVVMSKSISSGTSYNVSGGSTIYIGKYNSGMYGCVSDFRVVTGSTVYGQTTGAITFTPPTSRLTNISGTLLLTAQNKNFIDNSSTPKTITPADVTVANILVVNAGPFEDTSLSNNYGSIMFNGGAQEDRITAYSSGTSFDLSGDFCIEGWFYNRTVTNNVPDIALMSSQPEANGFAGFRFTVEGGTLWFLLISGANTLHLNFNTGYTVKAGEWYHVAASRSGSSVKVFVNGTQVGATQTTSGWTGTGVNISIGRVKNYGDSSSYWLNGYASDIRIINGSAVRTSNFSVPTSPLSAVSNTKLLIGQYADAKDSRFSFHNKSRYFNYANTATYHATTTGQGPTQGSFSPYMMKDPSYFFTTGSGITTSTGLSSAFTSSSATFTIEAWIFLNTYGASSDQFYNRSIFSVGATYMTFGVTSNGTLMYYSYDGSQRLFTTSATITKSRWTHVAVVVTGGTIKLFIDGVQSGGNGTHYGNNGGTQTPCIGSTVDGNATTNRHFDGFISQLRVSNSARYSGTFTPHTTPHTSDGNTILLLNTPYLKDSSSNNYSLTNNTGACVNFSPFVYSSEYSPSTHGGSLYCPGNGNALRVFSHGKIFALGETFSIECWVYQVARGTNSRPWATNNVSSGLDLYVTTAGVMDSHGSSGPPQGNETGAVVIPLNFWTHVAIDYNNNLATMYINGVAVDAGVAGMSSTDVNDFVIGNLGLGGDTYDWHGYISDIRLSGDRKRTGNFTPPTSPLTSTQNDTLLFNFNDGVMRDATGTVNVGTTGNGARLDNKNYKFGSGGISVNQNSTNGIIELSYVPGIFRMANDWTIEYWFKGSDTSVDSQYRRVLNFGGGNNTNALQILIDTTGGATYNAQLGGHFLWDNVQFIPETATGSAMPNGTDGNWHHHAFVRTGNELRSYFDGVYVNSRTVSASAVWDTTSTTWPFWIGAADSRTQGRGIFAIDDLRISRIARYTGSSFTVPTRTLPTIGS